MSELPTLRQHELLWSHDDGLAYIVDLRSIPWAVSREAGAEAIGVEDSLDPPKGPLATFSLVRTSFDWGEATESAFQLVGHWLRTFAQSGPGSIQFEHAVGCTGYPLEGLAGVSTMFERALEAADLPAKAAADWRLMLRRELAAREVEDVCRCVDEVGATCVLPVADLGVGQAESLCTTLADLGCAVEVELPISGTALDEVRGWLAQHVERVHLRGLRGDWAVADWDGWVAEYTRLMDATMLLSEPMRVSATLALRSSVSDVQLCDLALDEHGALAVQRWRSSSRSTYRTKRQQVVGCSRCDYRHACAGPDDADGSEGLPPELVCALRKAAIESMLRGTVENHLRWKAPQVQGEMYDFNSGEGHHGA